MPAFLQRPDKCDRCRTWPVKTVLYGLDRYCFACWIDVTDPKDQRTYAAMEWDFQQLLTGWPK